MMKTNGYNRIFRRLKLIENPDLRLLTILVEMIIEEKYEDGKSHKLKVPLCMNDFFVKLSPFITHVEKIRLGKSIFLMNRK